MLNPLISIIEEDARKVVTEVDMKDLVGKSVLVTGASGLLGTHILASLREATQRGRSPLSVTAVVYSEPTTILKSFLDFRGAHIVRGDLTDMDFVKRLGWFDYIIHAAGYGQPSRFMEDRIKTIKINTSTTLALFDRLVKDGHLLFVSSGEVYSGLSNSPHKETEIGTTNTTHARSCYIEGKRCGEAICNAYRAQGIHANSARVVLSYGPGTKSTDRRAINVFIERGLIQKKITLQDVGAAKRTYCYVSDTIEILWNILLQGREPIYNVGGLSRITIAELARQVGCYLDVPVEFPKDGKELSGAPKDVCLDMSLVKNEFNKIRYVTFEEGLARTIEWQKVLYNSLLQPKERDL